MPILPLRYNRIVTLESATKDYDNFYDVETIDNIDGQLWGRASTPGAMENLQGSSNHAVLIDADLGNLNFLVGRFDATNFGTLAGWITDPGYDENDYASAVVGGTAYAFQFKRTGAGPTMTFTLAAYSAPFAVDGTAQELELDDISSSLGTYVWAADALFDFAISFGNQRDNCQFDWPTDKALLMGVGRDITDDPYGSTLRRLFGFVFDGSGTIEVVNIAEFDIADVTGAVMLGNNQTDGVNDSAMVLLDATRNGDDTDFAPVGHLYRMAWTAGEWDNGEGTFDNTQVEYTFDDAGLNSLIADSGLDWLPIATHNDCNFMFGLRNGYDTGDTATEPFLVVISKDWDWYDKVTFVAADGDTDAAAILASYQAGTLPGSISYNADEGVLYFVSGPGDPFTYCTGEFAPCEESGGGGGGEVDDDIHLRVWGFSLDDHDYAVFRLGTTESLIFDLKTKQWSQWASPELDYWRPHVGMNWIGIGSDTVVQGLGSDIVCGDSVEGALYILDPETGQDDDPVTGVAAPFTRRVTGSITLRGRDAVPCNAVQLDVSLGAPSLTGAEFSLRTSDDAGHNWLSHGDVEVPADTYATIVEWRALGLARQPGRLFSFEDNGAAVRVSGAELR